MHIALPITIRTVDSDQEAALDHAIGDVKKAGATYALILSNKEGE